MKIRYKFVDGTVAEIEGEESIGAVIKESRRLEGNLARKESWHCYSLEAIQYEGAEYSDGETPETKMEHGMDTERIAHAKGYKKMKKGEVLYIYNGGMANGTSSGTNGGAYGNNYSNTKQYGAGGGGSTHVATKSGILGNTSTSGLNYNNRNCVLTVAGGGGGGGGYIIHRHYFFAVLRGCCISYSVLVQPGPLHSWQGCHRGGILKRQMPENFEK